MILRVRAFCREESLGIVLPATLIALFAMWQVIEAAVTTFLLPLVASLFEERYPEYLFDRLVFDAGSMQFGWTMVFVESVAAVVLGATIYFLFVRPIPDDVGSETGMRDCPECLSRVVVEARRCAFCTSALPAAGTEPL